VKVSPGGIPLWRCVRNLYFYLKKLIIICNVVPLCEVQRSIIPRRGIEEHAMVMDCSRFTESVRGMNDETVVGADFNKGRPEWRSERVNIGFIPDAI
jgi:hypothetical protein